MEMDAKRIGILKKINITHYAIIVVVVLIFLQWFMPYFRYEPTGKKDTKQQTSMWGEILSVIISSSWTATWAMYSTLRILISSSRTSPCVSWARPC